MCLIVFIRISLRLLSSLRTYVPVHNAVSAWTIQVHLVREGMGGEQIVRPGDDQRAKRCCPRGRQLPRLGWALWAIEQLSQEQKHKCTQGSVRH